ncbi:MAG TPA: DUF817 domain-containing protein [Candidatus Paceibacterota bacterium]|nr:DUF817 domain-containing protein [Candidatus Paceibacterota bacterium]
MPSAIRNFILEFIVFGIKQARACVFAGSFFVLLFLSNYLPLLGLARYDFLFLAAILLQLVLYVAKLETWSEVKMIFLFHIVGLVLELYKTSEAIGSWSYPEEAFFKIATVPLFSGFMYAAVGSYISLSWRYMRLELKDAPNYLLSIALAALIYANFFTHHFLPDFRYALMLAVFLLFFRTRVYFTVITKRRWMHLNTGFALIAFFIWIAENISTYFGAWKYPDQIHAWTLVGFGKIGSWFLLVIISFIIVAYLKHYRHAASARIQPAG